MRFSSMLGLALAQSGILGSLGDIGSKGLTADAGFDQALSLLGKRRTMGGSPSRSYRTGSSKYKAHIGAKQRARHAGRPDGLMHTPTPGLRSNDFKRALAVAVTAKPKRTRAKKAAAA